MNSVTVAVTVSSGRLSLVVNSIQQFFYFFFFLLSNILSLFPPPSLAIRLNRSGSQLNQLRPNPTYGIPESNLRPSWGRVSPTLPTACKWSDNLIVSFDWRIGPVAVSIKIIIESDPVLIYWMLKVPSAISAAIIGWRTATTSTSPSAAKSATSHSTTSTSKSNSAPSISCHLHQPRRSMTRARCKSCPMSHLPNDRLLQSSIACWSETPFSVIIDSFQSWFDEQLIDYPIRSLRQWIRFIMDWFLGSPRDVSDSVPARNGWNCGSGSSIHLKSISRMRICNCNARLYECRQCPLAAIARNTEVPAYYGHGHWHDIAGNIDSQLYSYSSENKIHDLEVDGVHWLGPLAAERAPARPFLRPLTGSYDRIRLEMNRGRSGIHKLNPSLTGGWRGRWGVKRGERETVHRLHLLINVKQWTLRRYRSIINRNWSIRRMPHWINKHTPRGVDASLERKREDNSEKEVSIAPHTRTHTHTLRPCLLYVYRQRP